MKVYIWGTGMLASDYIKKGEIAPDDILGYIERKRTKDIFAGKRVYEPQEIVGREEYDYILVCVKNMGREICNLCEEVHIDRKKIILVDNWEWIDGSPITSYPSMCCKKIVDNGIDVECLFPQLYENYIKEADIQAARYMIISRNGYDLCEKNAPMFEEEYNTLQYQTDYFRYRTFELTANQLIRYEVKGNVAELGVFRGDFARLINEKFKDRTLYLFDTFESFREEEFRYELEKGRVPEEFLEEFKNTDVLYVMSRMPYPDKCVIRKGFFPKTMEGLEDKDYAFVSIDVDFEKSILEGLRYFYPRLNVGGVIFIHDYNNRFLEGVKTALTDYEKELGKKLPKIPLADEGGTLVLTK